MFIRFCSIAFAMFAGAAFFPAGASTSNDLIPGVAPAPNRIERIHVAQRQRCGHGYDIDIYGRCYPNGVIPPQYQEARQPRSYREYRGGYEQPRYYREERRRRRYYRDYD
jgi:hypothetical protein